MCAHNWVTPYRDEREDFYRVDLCFECKSVRVWKKPDSVMRSQLFQSDGSSRSKAYSWQQGGLPMGLSRINKGRLIQKLYKCMEIKW